MVARPLGYLLAALLVSCSKTPETGAAANDRGPIVARVGTVALYEDDVRRAMARDPGASAARFDSPAARRELIDGLVRFQLLAQAADRAGYTKDPDAIRALQQIAVTKLVNATLGAAAAPEAVSSADVQREYEAHRASEFTLPSAVRVRHIRVTNAKLAEALAVRARALAPEDDAGFARLASSYSEDHATRPSGGDLGFLDENSRADPQLLAAATALETPGQVAGPLPLNGAHEILRLVTLRAAAVSPLSSVAEPLRQRLYRERRARALEDYLGKLRKETPVQIVEQKPAVPTESARR